MIEQVLLAAPAYLATKRQIKNSLISGFLVALCSIISIGFASFAAFLYLLSMQFTAIQAALIISTFFASLATLFFTVKRRKAKKIVIAQPDITICNYDVEKIITTFVNAALGNKK